MKEQFIGLKRSKYTTDKIIKNNPNFYDFIPKVLKNLFETILSKGYKAYFYGESVFKTVFYEQQSYRYQIAIEMDFQEFLEFSLSNFGLKITQKNSLNFYFQKNQIFYLEEDYPEGDIIPDFHLKIFLCQNFLIEKKKSIFSIENLSYDGIYFFYNHKKIKKSFLKKEYFLSDLEDNLDAIYQNLCHIIRLSRYIIEFSLKSEWLGFNLDELGSLNPNIYKKNKKIRKEMITILDFKLPSLIFDLLREKKILILFFPEILEGFQMYQNKFHAYDVYWHCLKSCDFSDPKDSIIRIASLFHDIGKPRSKGSNLEEGKEKNTFYNHENIGAKMTFSILKRFGFSVKICEKVAKLVRLHMFYYTKHWTNRAVRRFIRNSGEDIHILFRLRSADRLGSGKKILESKSLDVFKNHIYQIIQKDLEFKVTDLAISGNDLKNHFELKQGPIIGVILNHLKDIVTQKKIENNLLILINYTREWVKNNIK